MPRYPTADQSLEGSELVIIFVRLSSNSSLYLSKNSFSLLIKGIGYSLLNGNEILEINFSFCRVFTQSIKSKTRFCCSFVISCPKASTRLKVNTIAVVMCLILQLNCNPRFSCSRANLFRLHFAALLYNTIHLAE